MSFLNVEDKTFLITGVANKKSVATFVAKTLLAEGANICLTVQSETQIPKVEKIFPEQKIYICDVEHDEQVQNLSTCLERDNLKLDGFLHSMAFANYSEGIKPFHETKWDDFAQATKVSCFSLGSLANALKDQMNPGSSVVTISISNLKATTYGYMGPIKSALEGTVAFLAKSFSEFSNIRFNTVAAGPLKTSASAGIPGYVDNYLYSEQLTLRHQALQTQEVANTISFLLSSRSSGINGEKIVVDAGMNANYFDQDVVKTYMKGMDV